MGAEQSQTQNNKSLSFQSQGNWINLGSREDRIYGNAKIYRSAEKPELQVAVLSHFCQNKNEYTQLISSLKQTQELNDIPGVVKLYEIAQQNEESFCSNFYKVLVAYEYLEFTLQQEFEDRMNIEKQFQPVELLDFLKQILQILVDLEASDVCLGDLRPDMILVLHQDNQITYKLADVYQQPTLGQYTKLLINLQEQCYLSPELFAQLGQKIIKPQFDQQKCDIFTIGLICFTLGLGNVQDLYDFDNFTLDENLFNSLLQQFEKIYGGMLTSIIKQMLCIDAQLRPTLQEAYERVICTSEQFQTLTYKQQIIPSNTQSVKLPQSTKELPAKETPRQELQQLQTKPVVTPVVVPQVHKKELSTSLSPKPKILEKKPILESQKQQVQNEVQQKPKIEAAPQKAFYQITTPTEVLKSNYQSEIQTPKQQTEPQVQVKQQIQNRPASTKPQKRPQITQSKTIVKPKFGASSTSKKWLR